MSLLFYALAKDEEALFIKPWMINLADGHYPVSINHARQMLGWEPRHRLRNTLPRIIDHLKQNPVRWFEVKQIARARRSQR